MGSLTERSAERPVYPFAAVAGMPAAKEAILLLAVEPRLKGVVVAAAPGSGKTVLTRSLKTLVSSEGGGPSVELPLHATIESLLGALDLENTIERGRPMFSSGLLARAHQGILFIDHLERIEPAMAAQIAQALNRGEVVIEREGFSLRAPSRFRLVTTYVPSDGEVSPAILNAVGMHVFEDGCLPEADRLTMLRRVEAFSRNPAALAKEFADATERLARQIAAARERLPHIDPTPADLRYLSSAALGLGVEGHAAECFCLWLIRARAALMGRLAVTFEDLEAAIRFVLAPRGRARSAHAYTPAHEDHGRGGGQRASDRSTPTDAEVADCPAPPGVLCAPGPPGGRPGGRGRGRRGHATDGDRGRYVRALPGPAPGGKVALDATLRAAAPFQLAHRRGVERARTGGVEIRPRDLRFKQFQLPSGALVVFAVDASGSMAMNRITLAKGALMRLLREANVYRDKVSLVAFRGCRGEILLPPSRSMELAKRAVEGLKVGDGTPLAAGLQAALKVIRRERLAGPRRALLVLFTDGGANVPLVSGRDVWGEIGAAARDLGREETASVVIDTTVRHLSAGRAERLAATLGGRLVRLPAAGDEALHGVLAGMAGELRQQDDRRQRP